MTRRIDCWTRELEVSAGGAEITSFARRYLKAPTPRSG
jgi:hypothetical protein